MVNLGLVTHVQCGAGPEFGGAPKLTCAFGYDRSWLWRPCHPRKVAGRRSRKGWWVQCDKAHPRPLQPARYAQADVAGWKYVWNLRKWDTLRQLPSRTLGSLRWSACKTPSTHTGSKAFSVLIRQMDQLQRHFVFGSEQEFLVRQQSALAYFGANPSG